MKELAILILVLFLGSCAELEAGGMFSYEMECEYQEQAKMMLCANSFDRCYIGSAGIPSCVSIH